MRHHHSDRSLIGPLGPYRKSKGSFMDDDLMVLDWDTSYTECIEQ